MATDDPGRRACDQRHNLTRPALSRSHAGPGCRYVTEIPAGCVVRGRRIVATSPQAVQRVSRLRTLPRSLCGDAPMPLDAHADWLRHPPDADEGCHAVPRRSARSAAGSHRGATAHRACARQPHRHGRVPLSAKGPTLIVSADRIDTPRGDAGRRRRRCTTWPSTRRCHGSSGAARCCASHCSSTTRSSTYGSPPRRRPTRSANPSRARSSWPPSTSRRKAGIFAGSILSGLPGALILIALARRTPSRDEPR